MLNHRFESYFTYFSIFSILKVFNKYFLHFHIAASISNKKTDVIFILDEPGSKSGLLVLNQISDFNMRAISIEDLLPKELLRQAVNNYVDELVSDESLSLVKGSQNHLGRIKISGSIYKNSIAPFIRDNFTNPSKEPEEWNREKVPISKVGIARHFEKIISNEGFDYNSNKSDFGSILKLIKMIINKLKLLN